MFYFPAINYLLTKLEDFRSAVKGALVSPTK